MSRSKESTIRAIGAVGAHGARGAKAATIGISLAALLLSCSNILTGNDMKKAIGADVAAANAATVTIIVQPDATTNGGTTQPLGQTTVKVGIPFDLTTTVGSAFVFGSWTQIGGNGEVTFQSTTSATTTATLTKDVSGVVIQANYIARPVVSGTDPFNGNTGQGINKSIKIVFSTPVEVSSLKNNIIVTTVNYSDLGNATPTDISSDFSVSNIGLVGTTNPTVTGVLLSPTKKMGVTQYIQVTCKKAVCDAAGHTMASDYIFSFITGSSIVPPPTITSFAITKGDGTALGSPDFALNSATIGLTVEAELSTAGQAILDTQVVETALTSDGAPTGTPVTTDLHTYSSTTMPYTLKTSGQGYKLIQVQLEDNYYQWTTLLGSSTNLANGSSVFDTYKILYDSSSAAVSVLTLNGGNRYTKSGAITLGFTLSKSAAPAAVLKGYMIKDSATTPTAPLIGDSGWTVISGGPTSFTGSAIAYTLGSFANTATSNVYVYVKDEAGNIGNANAAIIGDNVAPAVTGTVSYATTGNPGYVKNGQTVSIAFTMLEATSGLNAGSPSVKIGGQSATISGTYSTSFTASLALAGTAATEGPLGYTIDATDNAGNAMTEVSGSTGIVYDRTAPTFAVGTIATNGNAGYAKKTNTITVNFTATEAGSGFASGSPSVTIDGQTATISGSYPSYMARYTIVGTEAQTTAGYVINGTDKAGNPGSASGSTGVIVDYTKPTFSVGTITTSGNAGYAKKTNTITVNFTATEAGSGFASGSPSATIDGQSATIGGSYPNYTASYTIAGTETQATAGYVINGTDKAGNVAATASGSTGILVDYTPPTISALTISSSHTGYAAWATTGDTIILGITASDGGSGLLSGNATIAGKSATASTTTATYQLLAGDGVAEGPASYSLSITDKAGNSTTIQTGSTGTTTVTGSVTMDRTGPVLTLTSFTTNTASHNTAYANNTDVVKLVLTANDTAVGMGLAYAPVMAITVNGVPGKGMLTQPTAATVAGGTTYSYTATYALNPTDVDGAIVYSVTAKDALGNFSNVLTGGGVTFYQTVPTIASVAVANTMTGNSSYTNTSLTISLGTVTVNPSGIYSKQYREGTGGTWTTLPSDGKVTLTTTSGSLTIQVKVTDNAGNATIASASPIAVEIVAPTIASVGVANTMTGNSSYTNTSLTISLGTITVNPSGIYSKQYREGTGGAWTTLPSDGKVTLTTTSGSLTIQVQVTDNAGNATIASASPIAVEIVAPTIASVGVANTMTGSSS